MSVIMTISNALMRAYPKDVQAEFGSEIAAVHAQHLAAAANHGAWALFSTALHEWVGLGGDILFAHYERIRQQPMRTTLAKTIPIFSYGVASFALGCFVYFLFMLARITTDMYLDPWDAIPRPYPAEHWQSQLHDSLSSYRSAIAEIVAWSLLIGGAVGLIRRLQQPERQRLLWDWAAYHALLLFTLIFSAFAMIFYQNWLSEYRGSMQIGYHTTWVGLVFLVGGLISTWYLALRPFAKPQTPNSAVAVQSQEAAAQ